MPSLKILLYPSEYIMVCMDILVSPSSHVEDVVGKA